MGDDEKEIRDKELEGSMRGEGGSDCGGRSRGCGSRQVAHLTDV